MEPSLARGITRTASTQTFLTIRFLVDRDRAEDAFRAYAYFRWLDDCLDAEDPEGPTSVDAARLRRIRLVDRQQLLLDRCLRGETPRDTDAHEEMLAELVRHADPGDPRLASYLRHMMLVMAFDVRRRGRLVSGAELEEYTRWLAVAVSDAMHYFIGHGSSPAPDDARYLAVSGAHVLHMLRDTFDDLRTGYYNVPREVLEAGRIAPHDVDSDGYRAWVEERVRVARAQLDGGRAYFADLDCRRHRLAGLAYIARFAWLADTIERDAYRLRARYDDARSRRTGLRMSGLGMAWMAGYRGRLTPAAAVPEPDR